MTTVKNSLAITDKELKQRVEESKKNGPSKDALEMKNWLNKFHEIEEKNKCLRVQFLDWLSDKLLSWSNKLHVWSVRIDSPCVIKIEPRKKEDSKDAHDRSEIAKLKERIKQLNEENTKLWADRTKVVEERAKEVA